MFGVSNNNEVWIKKKKHSTRKWVIPLVIGSIFIFTAIAIWLQYATSTELSSTLITCFYGFCGGELWLLASITKTKTKSNNSDEEESNNDDLEGEG